jgi:hypothetical protein
LTEGGQHKIVAMRSVLKKNKHRWKGELAKPPFGGVGLTDQITPEELAARLERAIHEERIHYLLRQRHEVAGSRAGLAWDEESTRLSLKDRDAHHIPDAKRDPSRRQSTGKHIPAAPTEGRFEMSAFHFCCDQAKINRPLRRCDKNL